MAAVWDMPCEAIEAIKSLQPYVRGNAYRDDPLWKLNRLRNLDSHVTMAINSSSLDIEVVGPPSLPRLNYREFDNGTAFFVPLAFKDQIELKPRVPELIFGEPLETNRATFEIRESEITEIYEFIRDTVIPRFTCFFPSPPYPKI